MKDAINYCEVVFLGETSDSVSALSRQFRPSQSERGRISQELFDLELLNFTWTYRLQTDIAYSTTIYEVTSYFELAAVRIRILAIYIY